MPARCGYRLLTGLGPFAELLLQFLRASLMIREGRQDLLRERADVLIRAIRCLNEVGDQLPVILDRASEVRAIERDTGQPAVFLCRELVQPGRDGHIDPLAG